MNRELDIAKNSLIFTVARLSAQFIGFLLLPLYSALLTPEDYGTADLINTLVFLFLPFVGVQLETALFRFAIEARQDKGRQQELLSTVMFVNIVQIAVFAGLFVLLRPLFTLSYVDFILINVVLLIPVNSLLQFMRGLGMNIKYSIALFITSVSGLVMNVLLVAVFRMGVAGIVISSAVSQLLTLIFCIIALKPWKYVRRGKIKINTAKDLFKYSLPLVPNQLAWWVMGISDRLVISGVVGVAANGIYSLANRFSSVYTSVTDSINLSWGESTALHYKEKDGREYVSGMIDSLFVMFASGCFSFIALIPYAFLLINKNYSDSLMQIPILMIAVLSQAVVGLYSSVLIAMKNTKSIAVTSIIAAATNLLLDVLLVHHIGIYAGSISTLAAFTLLAILRCITVRKVFGISPNLKLLALVVIWGALVVYCFFLQNTYLNIASLIVTVAISFIANRKTIAKLLTFAKNKLYNMRHQARRKMLYGKIHEQEAGIEKDYTEDLIKGRRMEDLLVYKDESWNYIKDLAGYQKYLAKGKKPNWEDNLCPDTKYKIEGGAIVVKTGAIEDNWLCFYPQIHIPDSFEVSYDITINTEFTEVQLAFSYKDLGNRYRFMVKDNKACVFEAVYEGDFLEPLISVPYSLSLGERHNICVRVERNTYAFYIDGRMVIAVSEAGDRTIRGPKVCLILWNKTDSNGIDCRIEDLKIRGL
ncbi:MAG: oligosaccharide flippase family protein [Saccharofermentans sp.]|nr:oligosaccharide flippase family protein [Saccharofermentans sp.]